MTWPLYLLQQSQRHHINLEHRDSPGCCHVGAKDLLIHLSAAQRWKELSTALVCAHGRAGSGGKASTEATSGSMRQKGICKGNHIVPWGWSDQGRKCLLAGQWQGLGPRGVKLSIKPCPVTPAPISWGLWNVNTHAPRHKVTTKCLLLKRNFLLSSFSLSFP